jgi:hypothetical protein
MSFVCCETLPTTITSCASADVLPATEQTAGIFTSADVVLDVSRAPYRRVCITVSAPVYLFYSSGNDEGDSAVTLSLYRNGVLDPVDEVILRTYVNTDEQHVSVTPILVHQADPGVFHATLTVTYPNPAAQSLFEVTGRINITASVANLAL